MSSPRRVLLLGLDPHAVPGVDAALVDTAIAIGNKQFADAGIPVDHCLFGPDAGDAQIVAGITAADYACVVIGGGLRKPDDQVALLERAIQLIRQHAPRAAIAFNTNPTTSLEAARRWLG
jgi:hypothetical protein